MSYQIIDNNIVMPIGDTATIPLTFNIDITGSTIYLSAKATLSDTSYALQVSNSVHDNATNGISHIKINPVNTKYLKAGNYYIDFVIVLASGDRHTFYPKIENTYNGEIDYLVLQEHVYEA